MAGIKLGKEDINEVSNPLKNKASKVSYETMVRDLKSRGINSFVGIFNEPMVEPVPHFIKAGCEKVIDHQNLNAQIVFGRDRPAGRHTGYGGSGMKNSSAIDLVVGRGGPNPIEVDERNEPFWVDNNYENDAARVVISQRTNVDQNFNIKGTALDGGATYLENENISAVAAKADCVRLIARHDVKIVTGTDTYNSKGLQPGVNQLVDKKICLIGNNRPDLLQPMVKGDNLLEFLKQLVESINGIISSIDILVLNQNKINIAVLKHQHISPFFGIITPPSQDLIETLTPITNLLTNVKSNNIATVAKKMSDNMLYLNAPSDGIANNKNILSLYNFCN